MMSARNRVKYAKDGLWLDTVEGDLREVWTVIEPEARKQ